MRVIRALNDTRNTLSDIHDQISPEYKNRIRLISAELNRIKTEYAHARIKSMRRNRSYK